MPAGRPKAITDDVLRKLEYAFKLGCTNAEACNHADIASSTLYDYLSKNTEYSDTVKLWKETPIFKARDSVLRGIETDHNLALKFLERKKKDEFSLRTESTGADGEALNIGTITINHVKPKEEE